MLKYIVNTQNYRYEVRNANSTTTVDTSDKGTLTITMIGDIKVFEQKSGLEVVGANAEKSVLVNTPAEIILCK